MLNLFYVMVAISHLLFALLSAKPKYNKTTNITVFCCYSIFFILFCLLPYSHAIKFAVTYVIYLALYMIFSRGKFLYNFFILTSYTTIITIFFGIVLSLQLFKFTGDIIIRWILIALVFVVIQIFLYKIMVPSFMEAIDYLKKGWGRLLIGATLFFIMIFMQIFYPYQLSAEEPLRIVVFYISSATYVFTFRLIFFNFKAIIINTQNEKEKKHFEELAYRDPLTTLLNKTSYDAHTKSLNDIEFDESLPKVALTVMDIDKFKSVNDTYGHLTGDETLKKVADAIESVFMAPHCKAFRIGGDEFAIISEGIESSELDGRIATLREKILKEINISISAGYAYLDFSLKNPAECAFKIADKNMYKVKYS